MKKRNLFFLPLVLILLFLIPHVQADGLEMVRVVKIIDEFDDMVIERESGERLLIQHHKACSTMSTEFPVRLVWEGDEVVQVKVASNEICKVYNFAPYSGEVTIDSRILSGNALVREHLAKIVYKNDLYEIDYAEGCRYLRDYVGKRSYVQLSDADLEGATLYLPKARGECVIESATLLEEGEEEVRTDFPIKQLQYKAENNQIYFSWDAFEEDESWLPIITYSKFPFNPDEYDQLSRLPHIKRTRNNSLRIQQLLNDQVYYFYVAAQDADGNLSEWKTFEITPVKTNSGFKNNPDPEKFEIEMDETDDAFIMRWPEKADVSRRYLIQVFVDGKREVFKSIDTTAPEFIIEKRPEWSRSRFRMTVRTIPNKVFGARFFDSIFWRKG